MQQHSAPRSSAWYTMTQHSTVDLRPIQAIAQHSIWLATVAFDKLCSSSKWHDRVCSTVQHVCSVSTMQQVFKTADHAAYIHTMLQLPLQKAQISLCAKLVTHTTGLFGKLEASPKPCAPWVRSVVYFVAYQWHCCCRNSLRVACNSCGHGDYAPCIKICFVSSCIQPNVGAQIRKG